MAFWGVQSGEYPIEKLALMIRVADRASTRRSSVAKGDIDTATGGGDNAVFRPFRQELRRLFSHRISIATDGVGTAESGDHRCIHNALVSCWSKTTKAIPD